MTRLIRVLALGVLLMTIGACVGLPAYQPYRVTFWADVTQYSDGRFGINLKVQNRSAGRTAPLATANASMELRDEDGVLRAGMQIVSFPGLERDDTADIASWLGQLDSGGYQLLWGAPGLGHSVVVFSVAESEGRLVLGEVQTIAYPDQEMPSLPPFGVAQPLVERAITQLAGRCDVEPELIKPLRVEGVDFPDASLGVPEPGRMAAQVITPGYVMELSCNGRIYTYHAGGERVVLAAAPEEVGPLSSSISIASVEVGGGLVVVRGSSALSEGTCLSTELWVGGAAAEWWPVEQCVAVQDGGWQIAVPLAEGDAPVELDPTDSYVLGAWLPGGPNIVSTFPFDLAGPPTEARPTSAATVALPMNIRVGGAGISFQVPDEWLRGEGWTWSPPATEGQVLGFQWGHVAQRSEPEAIFLPPNAVMLGSEALDLGWATGRWYEMAVYHRPAAGQTGGQIAGYERHVVLMRLDEAGRTGLDFYAHATTRAGLMEVRPLVDGMVASAIVTP